jgi:hypothetical protein
MKQMTVLDVPVLRRMAFGMLKNGFTRDYRGKIFFLATRGDWIACFPVLEDKTIMRETDYFPHPGEQATLVHPKNLGIAEIKWAPEGTKLD